MRVILYTGKGGVGKTTLSAATALASSAQGLSTLVISTDIAHSLADSLDTPLGNEPRPIQEGLWACELDTGEELERYWGDIRRRLASVLKEHGIDAPVAGELSVLPGLDEILALVRIKRYAESDDYDVMVIDSAPTGAAMRLLGAPDLQRWYTHNMLGISRGLKHLLLPALRRAIKLPIDEATIQQQLTKLFDEVKALREILTDGELTSVRLVLNPDHMSLQETQRAHTYMSLYGLSVDAIMLNRIIPGQVVDPYFAQWKADQAVYRQRIIETFEPLPVFEVPLQRSEIVGLTELSALADELFGGRDPSRRLSTERSLRFFERDGLQILAMRVTGVQAGAIDLNKDGNLLRIKLNNFRRSIILPQYMTALQPAWARIEGGELRVAFREPVSPAT